MKPMLTFFLLSLQPGFSALPILHYNGRDATDEVEAFHAGPTLKKLYAFSIGRVHLGTEGWPALLPPINNGWVRKPSPEGGLRWTQDAHATDIYAADDEHEHHVDAQILLVENDDPILCAGPSRDILEPLPTGLSAATQAAHSRAYKELHQRIVDAGLYQCRYITGYGPEVLRYACFAMISYVAYQHRWFFTSALSLGALWHQLVFTVHDLGHMGVTHNWVIDRIISIIIADWVGGLSIGWWVHNHNVHHVVTNHPSHDPDIQHLPFFAISPDFLRSIYSSYYGRTLKFDRVAEIFIPFQHKLFYVVMSLARFNLYRLSYEFLWKSRNDPPRARGGRWAWWGEIVGLVFWWAWYTRVLIGTGSWGTGFMYLLVSNVVPSPLHVQIVLSHFSMSTAVLGPVESFPHRQLRTTSDVKCHSAVEWIHGGLQLQVTHHLFPRLPRHNLKAASALVKDFAREQGLTYAEFGFVEGNGDVIGVLRGVANQVRIMTMVADSEIEEALSKEKLH
ncbi:fatty acid/sphingolipid desaturase [Peniophora sp. CONT]|nr:fatty acid/sphingolipid desaturase [Peniophora sp. CONT]